MPRAFSISSAPGNFYAKELGPKQELESRSKQSRFLFRFLLTFALFRPLVCRCPVCFQRNVEIAHGGLYVKIAQGIFYFFCPGQFLHKGLGSKAGTRRPLKTVAVSFQIPFDFCTFSAPCVSLSTLLPRKCRNCPRRFLCKNCPGLSLFFLPRAISKKKYSN